MANEEGPLGPLEVVIVGGSYGYRQLLNHLLVPTLKIILLSTPEEDILISPVDKRIRLALRPCGASFYQTREMSRDRFINSVQERMPSIRAWSRVQRLIAGSSQTRTKASIIEWMSLSEDVASLLL